MGGGSDKQAPYQPSPKEEAEARDWEAQQSEARATRERERTDALKATQDAENLSKWGSGRANQRRMTEDYGRSKLGSYGLDTSDRYGIWDQFNGTLGRNDAGLKDNDDYSTALGTGVFDNVLSDARGRTRTKLGKDFQSNLGDDYYDTAFADTIDDSILDSILGEQYADAQTDLKNSADRGQMNQTAYARSLDGLAKAKTTARGELETIGKGVIGSAKDATSKLGASALTKANDFDFSDTFDAAGEAGKVRNKGTSALSTLDTDIRRSIGDRQFFDPSTLMAKSIAKGGTSNYNAPTSLLGTSTDNPLYSVFDDQARKKTTEGVF